MLLWSKRSEHTASPKKTTGRKKPSPAEKCSKQLRWECSSCSPNFNLKTPFFHSGAAYERPETTQVPKLSPMTEVVWQQPTETITDQANLKKTNNYSLIYHTQETSKTTVANQTSPPKGTQPQNYVVNTKHSSQQEIKQGTNQYRSLTTPRIALPISKNRNSM